MAIGGKSRCASSAEISSSGSPKVFAQPDWRASSSIRSGVEARRSEPDLAPAGLQADLVAERR